MNGAHDASRLAGLDLNLFRVFDVVLQERSLTRAAEVLFLSQSAVSHALARLREQLGEPLFVREGRGVTPTPLAERLAPEIREALALLQQAVHRTRDFQPSRDVADVTLALNDALEPSLLPALRARVGEGAPNVRLSCVRVERSKLEADLASGRLDLAIDVAHLTGTGLLHTSLLRDSFCVVGARRRRSLEVETYLAARHVTVSSRRMGLAMEDVVLNRMGYQRQVAVRCQLYESACRIVAESDLLLTLPRRQAEAHGVPLGLHVSPMPLALPPIEVHLYWHRQTDLDPRGRWLREQVHALVRERVGGDGQTSRARPRRAVKPAQP
ncbi:MAG: LysR family transcriptional regulator [Cystobacter sp.]